MNKRLFQIKVNDVISELDGLIEWFAQDDIEKTVVYLEDVIITLNNLVHRLQTNL